MKENNTKKVKVSLWLPLPLQRNDGTDRCIFTKILEIDNPKLVIGVNYTFCIDDHWCIVTKVEDTLIHAETFTIDTREEFLRGFLKKGWSLNVEGAKYYDATRLLASEEMSVT